MTTQTDKFQSGPAAKHARNLEHLLREVRDWARRESLRRQLARERRQLLEMGDEMLKDLGITRHEAETEAQRDDIPPARMALLERSSRGSGQQG